MNHFQQILTVEDKIKIDTSNKKKRFSQSTLSFANGGESKRKRTLSVGKTITLYTKEEIENTLSTIRVFPDFLPDDLANTMIDALRRKRLSFKEKEFYIAGRLCRPSQKSIIFSTPENLHLEDLYSENDMKLEEFFPELYMAKACVDKEVNKALESLTNSHPFQIQKNWKSDVCIGNYFPNNKSHLDWHSDKLSNIGPLPTITSLSFGATRIFRLRPIIPTNSVIYNIVIPNNTLLIMLPGTQELYKHSVPTLCNSLLEKHPILNEQRFSLTFRMLHPVFIQNPTRCEICSNKMILRRIYKETHNNGYYMWICTNNNNGKKCMVFQYAKLDELYHLMNGGDGSTIISTEKEICLKSTTKNGASKWKP